MKNNSAYILLALAFFSCQSNGNQPKDAKVLYSNTEELAKSSEFLDVDVKYFTDTVYNF